METLRRRWVRGRTNKSSLHWGVRSVGLQLSIRIILHFMCWVCKIYHCLSHFKSLIIDLSFYHFIFHTSFPIEWMFFSLFLWQCFDTATQNIQAAIHPRRTWFTPILSFAMAISKKKNETTYIQIGELRDRRLPCIKKRLKLRKLCLHRETSLFQPNLQKITLRKQSKKTYMYI